MCGRSGLDWTVRSVLTFLRPNTANRLDFPYFLSFGHPEGIPPTVFVVVVVVVL